MDFRPISAPDREVPPAMDSRSDMPVDTTYLGRLPTGFGKESHRLHRFEATEEDGWSSRPNKLRTDRKGSLGTFRPSASASFTPRPTACTLHLTHNNIFDYRLLLPHSTTRYILLAANDSFLDAPSHSHLSTLHHRYRYCARQAHPSTDLPECAVQ